jgi:hypothetical protein
MPKVSVPATLGFLNARIRAVSRIIRLVVASAALVAVGSLSTMVTLGPKPADAAGDATHPGIFRIPLDTPLTERAIYRPGIAVGSFACTSPASLPVTRSPFGEAKRAP